MTVRTDTVTAAQDTWVAEATPNANYGEARQMECRTSGGADKFVFVYFPIHADKLAGATITSATLRLALAADSASTTFTAKRVTQAWKEKNTTFNTKPTQTATSAASDTLSGSQGDYIELDVTDIVQDWVNGKAVYGFRIEHDGSLARKFYTSESSIKSRRPRITVKWNRPPAAPEDLRPAADQAVTEAAPTLVWTSDTPSQFQVQIDTDSAFPTPDFDSGWVTSTDQGYDTSEDGSPPSLTDDTTYYWRVRIQDEDGLTSDWSTAAEFQRRTKGTLNITAPTGTVEETTPTVSHTFDDRTQASVEYELQRNGTTIWTKEKFATSATDFAIPNGYVKSQTATYTIIVRVWDTFSRKGIGYVEDSEDFTFDLASETAPNTFAAVTEDGHLLLTWSRGSAPDYFALREDGVLVADRIDPSEVSLGGGDYEYRHYTAAPRVQHTYEIEAVVLNGGVYKHSGTNPTVDATFSPIGIWLIDPDSGDEVRLLGKEQADMALGESGETFYLPNRQDPVRVVDKVRGLEGNVSGELVASGDRTAADERDAFMAMKADPLGIRRLVLSRRNLPVIVGEAAVSETPTPEERYLVSFAFWQVDEFEV